MSVVVEELDEPAIEARENSTSVVWKLAWPAVVLNSLQVVNQLLDRGFIGHLNSDAITAHGGAINVMFLMFSLAVAVATGATALVSRAFGAGTPSEYRLASRQSIRIAMIGGFLMAGVASLGSSFVAHTILPSDDPGAIDLMRRFVLVYSTSLPAIYVIQTLAGSLRGIGDTKSPMFISGVQILIHMTLNCLLVFPTHQVSIFGGLFRFMLPGANLGLIGAGTALSISAWISAIGYLSFVSRTPLGNLWGFHLPEWHWIVRILRIALPAALMATLRVLSLTTFTIVLAMVPNGSTAIGSMSTAFAIESIMNMPPFGLSAAAGALVGQSLGMRRPDRAERLGWTAANHGAIVTLALAGPIYLMAPTIAGWLLGNKPEMIAETITLLRYLCLTEVFFSYAMIVIGAMQGAGDTVRPMWITIFTLWGVRVPVAFVLALPAGYHLFPWLVMPFGLGWGARGAWTSMAFTQGLQGILALALFKQGAWKTKKV
ncbi:MAG: MATE family efflux transporter [Fimbriimonas sp.]|nr:MATE family efflux transporter [Fimbriimonas sp.]